MSGPLIGGGKLRLIQLSTHVARFQPLTFGNGKRLCKNFILLGLFYPASADEVNAIVLDVGTYQVKAGYAGEDTPKFAFPSVGFVLQFLKLIMELQLLNFDY
jgi:hypothetical protein